MTAGELRAQLRAQPSRNASGNDRNSERASGVPSATGATPAEARELRELVPIVAADWSESERAEALAVALADADSALVCFRALRPEDFATSTRARE
jgi:hypothetical protein